jgi:hypothetical protein
MTWQDKDWLDQPLHLGIGLIATAVLGLYLPWIESALLVMVCVFTRELWQHDWEWYRVGWLDLTFFGTGAALAALFI